MRYLFDCIRLTGRYTQTVHPIIRQKTEECYGYTHRIKKPSMRAYAVDSLNSGKFDYTVSSVCTLHPGIDVALATEINFYFHTIVRYLRTICDRSSINSEPFVRVIFYSLKDALNIRTDSFEKYFTFFPSKEDSGYLSILVEKCRQKILLLPSFDRIRDSLVAFLTLFIDLQIAKYSLGDNEKEVELEHWSSSRKSKYPGISSWEFCMAVDSTLTIQLLLALATDPELTENTVEIKAAWYFPWICGIHKILEGYIGYKSDLSAISSSGHLFYYANLKEYEDRAIYFINRAVSEMPALGIRRCRSILKILLSLYITHPAAGEGMNEITGRELYRAGGKAMVFFKWAAQLITYP